MALYLVQHGLSLAKEIDPQRGLSYEGKRVVDQIAQRAEDCGIKVDAIVQSGKLRALQTAEILAVYLRPEKGVLVKQGLKPLDDVKEIASLLRSDLNEMVVGHLPFMEKLTSYLVAGNDKLTVLKFQNGGIVCLDQDEEESWYIKWTLLPNIN